MSVRGTGVPHRRRTSVALVFRLLVGALLCSTLTGVGYALLRRPLFVASFPGAADPRLYRALLLTGVTGLVALAGLWRWRGWAVVLYGVLAVVSLTLDVLAEAPVVHQATVLGSAVLVLALARANRARFQGDAGRTARH